MCSIHIYSMVSRLEGGLAPKVWARTAHHQPEIETSVTFCGMMGFAGDGLRSDGVDDLPYPRAGALSCPSSAIARRRKGGGLPTVDGPGSQRSRPALVSTAKVSGLRRAFCLLALLVPAHLSSSAG